MNQSAADQRVDYIEMPASDLPATRAFFEAAFGWAFQDYGPAYTSWNDGRISGGFYQGEAPAMGGILVILFASDLEGSMKAVKAAGGRITREIFSFPGGRRFHFQEPSGSEWAVWGHEPES